MHHHIYHTYGFVLNSKNRGEANKIITLYTRELGLVRANAQGIRLLKSKSRFALQDFSYAKVDLVRGKEFWRITSSSCISSFPYIRMDDKSISLIFQISKLLERLCAGEEANQKIFDSLIQTFYLLDSEDLDEKSREAMELYLVFRIVYELGYVGESESISKYLGEEFKYEKIDSFLKERTSIVAHINKALKESQL